MKLMTSIVRYYHIVYLRERVEFKPLGKSPVRAELSSVEILLVEGISDLTKYSISVSLLMSHKKRGRKINITAVYFVFSFGFFFFFF